MNAKLPTLSLFLLSGTLFFSASCVFSPPIQADVESFERDTAGVSDVPETGDRDYIHAAERYSNPNSYRNPYSHGRAYRGAGYGYGFGYGAY